MQHLSTFHQWTGSVYGTVPFCAAQPLEGWDRRGERQAVKQFPPSESHSDPHTGDWGLTPARRWHKHRQTKGPELWASVDLGGSKSRTDWVWSVGLCWWEERLRVWGNKIMNISWQIVLFLCKQKQKTVILQYKDTFLETVNSGGWLLRKSRCKCWMDTEAAPSLRPPHWEKGFNSAEAPQRRQQKRFAKGRTTMTSCQSN